MSEEKLVPKLRFSGFDEDWIEINIKNYSTIKGRIGWRNLKQSEYTESGPYLIAGKHITNGIINWTECDHLSMERYDESPEIALKSGDVIFSKDGSLGNPALIRELPDKATINGTMMLVRLHDKVTPNFFYQVLNSDSFLRLLHVLKSGSSIPHIFQRDMENFKFKIPQSLKEQNQISSFLEVVDEKIGLLKKKYESYVNFKKYLMQQIFAQKLRFDFVEVKLKDISKINKGEQLNKDVMIEDGKYYVLNGGKDPSGYTNEWNVSENTITISEGGNSCGYVNFNTEKFWSGGHCYYLSNLDENVDDYYLYNYLKFKEKFIMHLRVGSGLPNIQKRDIENIKIQIISKNNQNKISNLFLFVDKKINSIQIQKENFENFKKGLLQQMFV